MAFSLLRGRGIELAVSRRCWRTHGTARAPWCERYGRNGCERGLGRADVDDVALPMSPLLATCFDGSTSSVVNRRDLSSPRTLGADRYWLLLELEELPARRTG